jgi:uncharacterized protein YcbX
MEHTLSLFVQTLLHYPLKSAQGIVIEKAALGPLGLAMDRRWVLIDQKGRFVSQRSCPLMGGLQVEVVDEILLIYWQGQSVTAVANAQDNLAVSIWADQVQGWGVAESVNQQLSKWLGQSVRLVYSPDQMQRQVDPDYAGVGYRTAFSDGFPLLVISQASLDALSIGFGQSLDMRRFRPNIVIGGVCAPFAEDQWQQIQIGDVVLDLVKPCSRCVIPSLDPDTQQPTDGVLRFLAQTRRRADGKVYLGQNAIARPRLMGADPDAIQRDPALRDAVLDYAMLLDSPSGVVQTDLVVSNRQGFADFLQQGQRVTVLASA